MATVWVVSLEWNDPPSEVTGETGIVGVFATEAAARVAATAEKRERHDDGQTVWQFSMAPDSHCIACGEAMGPLAVHVCKNAFPKDAEEFCDRCGAELGNHNSCDNDHDAWDIDVHVTAHEIKGGNAHLGAVGGE